MENQDRGKNLSLIVMRILYVVSRYAAQSHKAISEEKKIYDQIKDSLKGDRIGFYNYWIFIFYLFNAVYGMGKKLEKNGLAKEEFMTELMAQLKELGIYSLNALDVIEKYEGGVTKFIGNRICKELHVESAILELEINGIFIGYLLHGFYPSLEKAWSINASLEKKKSGAEVL